MNGIIIRKYVKYARPEDDFSACMLIIISVIIISF